jgi:hypothetical protein
MLNAGEEWNSAGILMMVSGEKGETGRKKGGKWKKAFFLKKKLRNVAERLY